MCLGREGMQPLCLPSLAYCAVPWYTLFNSDRGNKAGFGVLLLLKVNFNSGLKYTVAVNDIGSLFVEIKDTLHKKVTVRLVYRPPAQTPETLLPGNRNL